MYKYTSKISGKSESTGWKICQTLNLSRRPTNPKTNPNYQWKNTCTCQNFVLTKCWLKAINNKNWRQRCCSKTWRALKKNMQNNKNDQTGEIGGTAYARFYYKSGMHQIVQESHKTRKMKKQIWHMGQKWVKNILEELLLSLKKNISTQNTDKEFQRFGKLSF